MEHIIAFFIYSYLGASIEHINYYFSHTTKALANPIITGFPLYGFGAYMIIFINDLLNQYGIENLLVKFIVFAILLSILEYIVGIYVGAGPKSYQGTMVDSWDYSKESWNLDGKISLKHAILWGFAGLILIYIHPKLIQKIKCGVNCQ
ncbi:protein of unknown function DUF1113 [Klosneuvirus KNV1]|uniref:Uncharacterized protein n=1 Tax=Klosneuvirus KNV1 TaxID=1977640 RepID=A0A1V0SJI3_9VIRU|nr:protein of unknown function DUF1113 [Klosneuvirus KNV1]